MIKKIMTKKEKRKMVPLLKQMEVSRKAFRQASEFSYDAEKNMWDVAKEIWPDVKNIDHPDEGEWVVYLAGEEVELLEEVTDA